MQLMTVNMIIQVSYCSFWKIKIVYLINPYNRISSTDKLQQEIIINNLDNKDVNYHIITYYNLLEKFNNKAKLLKGADNIEKVFK